MNKSKWTQREFWVTVLPFILGLLTATGVVGPDDNAAIQGISSLILMAGPSMAYIIMRMWQKVREVEMKSAVEIETVRASVRKVNTPTVTPPETPGVNEPYE